jgi:hypothetical protein
MHLCVSIENAESGIVEERHSSRREDLKRELDEVLRGIREMGGVTAIFRKRGPRRDETSSRIICLVFLFHILTRVVNVITNPRNYG